MIATHGLNHISLSVRDPDVSLAFYTKLFGVREYHREGAVVQALGPGPHDVLVFERRPSHGVRGGIDHFGFRLTDPRSIDEAIEQARGAGAKILRHGEFSPGEPYLYIEDPDGYEIEIWFENPVDGVLTDALRALEESLLTPEVRGSQDALERLLADEFVEVGSSGRTFDKRRVLAELPKQPPAERALSGFQVELLAPDLALARYRASVRDGADSGPRDSLRSSIWRLRAGRWQLVFHQGTPVGSDTAP